MRGMDHNLSQDAKQDVGVEGPLVRFVHDHTRVRVQVLLRQTLSQQHPIRHELDQRLVARHILESNRVTDLDKNNVWQKEGVVGVIMAVT